MRYAANKLASIIGPEKELQIEAKIRFGKSINIDNPQTLSDKICYLEYRTNQPLVIKCSDKYDVRSYIRDKGLEELLVPLIGSVYSDINQLDFDALPQKFVLKATYGCQMNIICENKEELDENWVKKMVKGWLSNSFNRDEIEPHYKNIQKRVICEYFLENADSILDYKIHCFNGRPEFVLVCSERKKGLKLNLYDLEWKPINEIVGRHKSEKELPRPSQLGWMIKIAEKLSEDFPFVRVDLYQIDKKVYFGELTFTPDGGILSYFSKKFDDEMGKKLKVGIE